MGIEPRSISYLRRYTNLLSRVTKDDNGSASN
jgi:hypothetical protein